MSALKELMLREPRWTLAIAESLTCGHLQALVGATSGASDFFCGGITAYSLDQKVRHLGVDRALAEPVNSVSAEVAKQMARGASRMFGSTLGVATTGYAESVLQHGVQHPFAWWAVYCAGSTQGDIRWGRVDCPGEIRSEVQRHVAEAALAALVAWVRELRQV